MDLDIPGDYMDKLHDVFDLCDTEKKGYISVEHFVSLAKGHFGAEDQGEEDVQAVVKVMDRTGDGQIHFGEFCQGVKQILELCSPSTPPPCDQIPKLYNIGSEETLVPGDEDTHSCGTHDNSEQSTFNEYDIMTDDDQQQSNLSGHTLSPVPAASPSITTGGGGVLPVMTRTPLNSEDDRDSAISSKSNEQDHRREQEFEDFGDVDEVDSETDHSINKTPNRSLLPSNYSRKVSSSALASHLYRNGSFRSASSAGHSRRSSCSDDIYDDIDGSFVELNDKVQRLEAQVTVLTDGQVKTDEKQIKLKEENAQMVERIHLLEEQLREVEMRSQERLDEEQKKHREVLTRTDKEKSQQIELLTQSLHHIEKEYVLLKDEAPLLRADNERLRKDHSYLEDKLNETQQQLLNVSQEQQETQEKYDEDKLALETESKVNAQLIDELTQELDQLRNDNNGGRTRSSSNDLNRSQRKELEAHINRLKEEYVKVREQNEELQAQVLSSHYQEGRRLLQGGASLAQEFENLPKDELMKALKEQQEENLKMREYVDRITLRILEKNPSLLEIG